MSCVADVRTASVILVAPVVAAACRYVVDAALLDNNRTLLTQGTRCHLGVYVLVRLQGGRVGAARGRGTRAVLSPLTRSWYTVW